MTKWETQAWRMTPSAMHLAAIWSTKSIGVPETLSVVGVEGLFGDAVLDELYAPEEALAADVADAGVPGF